MSASRFSQLSDPKILVVRNDGLGDFVLTLPLVASLKRQIPAARLYGLVNHHLAELGPLLPDFEGFIADEGVLLKRHRGTWPAAEAKEKRAKLEEDIRAHRFDLAVLPYSESATARLVHRAGVPLRAGSLRRPYFWRFNLRNATSRKRSDLAEYELNLTYLHTLGLKQEFAFPQVHLPDAAGVNSPADFPGRKGENYVVMHPYKRNSTALAWPMANFVALAEEMLAAGLRVMVIGDAADAPVLDRYFGPVLGTRLVIGLALPDLMRLIIQARLFVGCSSGPLHLAGLCSTPHVAFYPRNQVSSPTRWRTLPQGTRNLPQGAHAPPHAGTPDGAPSGAATSGEAGGISGDAGTPPSYLPAPRDYLLAPQVPKACVVCEGERCPYFNCVAEISTQRAREAIAHWGIALVPGGGQAPAQAAAT